MRLTHARTLEHDHLVDLQLTDGRVVEVSPSRTGTSAAAPGDLDVDGRLVLPGLVETHLHLDKAHLDDLAPNPDGTLAGAIAVTGRLKAEFDAEGIAARARRVLDRAVAHGTTLIRAHPDVDPIIGTLAVEVLADLRAEYAGRIDLQIVAFPQEGVLQAPGTLRLLERAVRHGADVIGGCTYNEAGREDCERQVGLLLDLAERHGLPLDLHADFGDDPTDERFAMAGPIARAVRERGLEGRVSLGHMTSLGSVEPDDLGRTLDELARADVAVVLLPHTDLHLGGRADAHRVRRGLAPLHALWEAGVRTSYSSNNVRNAFTPFGNADLLETGLFLAQVAHLGSPGELRRIVDMATTEAARIAGIDATYGVHPGAAADLVVLDATDPVAALLDRAPRRWVLKRGRVVAETVHTTTLHAPSTRTTEHERNSA